MADLKHRLKEAVRKLARETSVDQLKKKGVRNVNVVGLDRIVGLIEEAVRRTLRHKLLGVDRDAVADATKEEFLRLLRRNEDLERAQTELEAQRERAEEEADTLRLELQRLKQELDERLGEAEIDRRAVYEGQNAQIVERIRAVFEAVGDKGVSNSASAQEHVLGMVMGIVEEERRQSIAAEEAARDRDVDLLQRRIRKLNGSLENSEKRLAEVSSLKDVDSGIASVYKDVQGLDAESGHFEQKKTLMANIFEANLKLQGKS